MCALVLKERHRLIGNGCDIRRPRDTWTRPRRRRRRGPLLRVRVRPHPLIQHVQPLRDQQVRLRPRPIHARLRLRQRRQISDVAECRLVLGLDRQPPQHDTEASPRHAAVEHIPHIDPADKQVVLDCLAVFPKGVYEACDSPTLASPDSSSSAYTAVIIARTDGFTERSSAASSGETIPHKADR